MEGIIICHSFISSGASPEKTRTRFSIGLDVDAFDGAAAGIVELLERGVPFKGDGAGAGYARNTWDAASGGLTWKMLFKYASVAILLFVQRRVDREALLAMSHLLIRH